MTKHEDPLKVIQEWFLEIEELDKAHMYISYGPKLLRIIRRAVETLEWYSDEAHWKHGNGTNSLASLNGGNIARGTLVDIAAIID